jgi:MSHA biogenesis protein MshG
LGAFSYRGRNGAGEIVKGALEAATAGEAASSLTSQGISPIEIKPTSAGALKKESSRDIDLFGDKIRHMDILMFTRQLYTLMKAGLPIMRALAGLQESAVNTAMKKMLGDLRTSLDSGRELSVAMARHNGVFTSFYLSMVHVGEMTGRLEDVFLRLYEHLDFERFMQEQVKSALRYPSFVVLAMVIAVGVVNVMVIPAFAKVFQGAHMELPILTRLLIATSNFTVQWWYVILAGLFGLVFVFRSWTATDNGRRVWDRVKLRIPVAGKIIRKATLARFARSFALASRSGVPIIQAMTTVAATVDNAYLAEKVEQMRDSIERGESVLRAAIATDAFTPIVLQMIAVGEESGALDEMMEEVAGLYQNDVEYELKTLAQQIEPIMIVMLGIMVLVLALGIFLPMWDMGKVTMGKR